MYGCTLNYHSGSQQKIQNKLSLVVPNLLFSAADSGLLALVGLRADPVRSGWYWTQCSCFMYSKTNSVLAYSTRSDKHEQNPTAGPKKPVPWEGDPCDQLPADQLGAKRSRGFILVGGCRSCRLGACSEPRLITGMVYPLLKIPWRGLLSHFGAAVVSRLPLS